MKTVRFGRKNARSIATDECIDIPEVYKNTASQMRSCQTADKKPFSPRRGRIALSANEGITEILDFAMPVDTALCQQAAAPSKEGAFLIFREENGRNMRFYHRQ